MEHRSSGRSHGRSLSIERGRPENMDENEWLNVAKTVRRARSLHRNATHQNAVNFLPSRHIGSLGAKMLGVSHMSLVDTGCNTSQPGQQQLQVDDIVQQMEQDENLMEDSPDAEEMRIEALRDMAQGLTVKRNIRAKITASVSRKSKHRPISCYKRFKYRTSFWWKGVKRNLRNILFTIELWYDSIKRIQGHFGSGVATYFRFLRWLFILDACASLILVSFIVLPQALYAGYTNNTIQTSHFNFIDVLTGQGFFTNTTMYYGFYSNEDISISNRQSYNLPSAYIFTMLVVYFAMFIILSISVARSYRRSFIETADGLNNVYANKIFCGWDFGISSAHAANIKSRSIYNEIKEMLSDSRKIHVQRTLTIRLALAFIKVGVHTLVLLLLGVTGLVMWILMDESSGYVPEVVTAIRVSDYRSLFMAIIITAIMVVFPIIFSFIVRFEQYSNPRTALFVTLLRTFFLEVVVISVLCIFWLSSNNPCWETQLGQEVYRLIVFDFLFSVLGLPLFEFLRSVISKHLCSNLGTPEFDIARNTLGLIYNQTLMWMGLFFSPLLCFIVTLKLAILFYVKRSSVLGSCQPSSRSWRAAQTHTLFLVLVFMSLLVILLTLGYVFVRVNTGGCGPFRSYDYIYLLFLEGILNIKEGNRFFAVIMYITKPGVVAFILIAMSVGAYYLRAKALAQKGMVKILRQMLVLGSKEKEYLLQAIAKVTDGDWVYNQKSDDESAMETSNTWKYLKDVDKMRKPSNSGFQFDVTNSPIKKRSIDHSSRASTPASLPRTIKREQTSPRSDTVYPANDTPSIKRDHQRNEPQHSRHESPYARNEQNLSRNVSPFPRNDFRNQSPDPKKDLSQNMSPFYRNGRNHSINQSTDPRNQPGHSRNQSPDPRNQPGHSRNQSPDPRNQPEHSRNQSPDPRNQPGHSRNQSPDPRNQPGHSRNQSLDPRKDGSFNHSRNQSPDRRNEVSQNQSPDPRNYYQDHFRNQSLDGTKDVNSKNQSPDSRIQNQSPDLRNFTDHSKNLSPDQRNEPNLLNQSLQSSTEPLGSGPNLPRDKKAAKKDKKSKKPKNFNRPAYYP